VGEQGPLVFKSEGTIAPIAPPYEPPMHVLVLNGIKLEALPIHFTANQKYRTQLASSSLQE